MKRVLFIVLLAVFSSNIFAQTTQPTKFDLTNYGVKIEPDKRLMTVLAALEAAGIETPLTEKGNEFRKKLRADLQDLNPELRQKLKSFVNRYKSSHPEASLTEIISPFVSMAYTLGPVPDLTEPTRTSDLPGDLLEVLDFAPLVREFYRRSLAAKLDGYVKDYQMAGDAMRKSAAEMVGELLEYLHTKPQLDYAERIKTTLPPSAANKKKTLQKVEIREHERRFFIVPELLASKGTINFRNVGDDYNTIVPPDTDLSVSEVRRAFLQFVIDPLVANNAKDISTFRVGIKALLDERRKENADISPDIFLTVSRSLVAAVEAKQIEFEKTRIATAQARAKIDQMKTDDKKRAVSAELEAFKKSLADETALQLSEAYERGAVLAFYFADQLKGLEYSGFDIASSLREMILSLDATKETNRLTQAADARNRALLAREERRKNAGKEMFIENPVTKRLLEIDKIVQAKNYTDAEKQLKELLLLNRSESRIYYMLGRVASLSAEGASEAETKRRLIEAKANYEYVISSVLEKANRTQSDAALMSLSYVAIARIHEFYGETEYAVKIYEAAIKVGDVADGAYKQAVEARQRLLKEK